MEYIDVKNGYTERIVTKIVKIIQSGGIAILPTDTVYGIVADAENLNSVKRIYEIKNRPMTKPVNILVSNTGMVKNIVAKITEKEKKVLERIFPGALTIIFEKNEKVDKIITAGLETVGIRMPNKKLLLEVIEKFRKTNSGNEL